MDEEHIFLLLFVGHQTRIPYAKLALLCVFVLYAGIWTTFGYKTIINQLYIEKKTTQRSVEEEEQRSTYTLVTTERRKE